MTYAWYGEGTRFLDISDPENPTPGRLLAAGQRHRLGLLPAQGLHLHRRRRRGVDVLRFTRGAKAATASRKAVAAPTLSSAQQKYLRGLSKSFQPDPSAGFICMLPT